MKKKYKKFCKWEETDSVSKIQFIEFTSLKIVRGHGRIIKCDTLSVYFTVAV